MAARARPWSAEEDDRLRELISSRRRLPEIAADLGRTMDVVRSRAASLGLPLSTNARPWRSPTATRR